MPRPDHIVVVILENKHRSSVTSSGAGAIPEKARS